jgi:hypothetical protein
MSTAHNQIYQLMTYFNSTQPNLPIKDIFQQFADYVKWIALRKRKTLTNKKISLKICTKTGVNLKISGSNRSPEGLDRVTQHCSLR